jgi:hypothetical protein
MPKKLALTFSDQTYEAIVRAAGRKAIGQFVSETLESQFVEAERDSQVASLIDAKLDAAIALRFKDQGYVELQTAERVAERALKWAKIAGLFLAIPAAIVVALFSFLGVKTYFDLRDVGAKIADAETTITVAGEIAQQAQSTSKDLIAQTEGLKSRLTEAELIVARVRGIEEQIPQLVERQRELEEQFKSIADGRVRLSSSEYDLEKPLVDYIDYLDSIGFPKSDVEIKVVRSADGRYASNAYYSSKDETLVLGRGFWYSASAALHTYTNHVLGLAVGQNSLWANGNDSDTLELVYILSDYFPSSFLDNPRVGDGMDASILDKKGFLRNLNNQKKFSDLTDSPHGNAEVWGGLLWSLRAVLGQTQTDRLVVAVWNDFPRDMPDRELARWLSAELLKRALVVATAEDLGAAVREIWEARGFPAD